MNPTFEYIRRLLTPNAPDARCDFKGRCGYIDRLIGHWTCEDIAGATVLLYLPATALRPPVAYQLARVMLTDGVLAVLDVPELDACRIGGGL